MAQRSEWIARFTALQDTATLDDASTTVEKELEDEAAIATVKIRGAKSGFVDSSTTDAGISSNEVIAVITAAADVDTTADVNLASIALLDGSTTSSATSINVDQSSTVAAVLSAIATAVGGTIRIQVGSEKIDVTAVVDGSSNTALTVTRGAGGTTAAAHSTNAAVALVTGAYLTAFPIDGASTGVLGVGDTLKFGSTGTERVKVTALDSTNSVVTVNRGIWETDVSASELADNANVYQVYNDADIAAAVASAVSNGAEVRLVGGPTWPDFADADRSVAL